MAIEREGQMAMRMRMNPRMYYAITKLHANYEWFSSVFTPLEFWVRFSI